MGFWMATVLMMAMPSRPHKDAKERNAFKKIIDKINPLSLELQGR